MKMKKAQTTESLMLVMELFLLVLVILFIFYVISERGKFNDFKKAYVSRDVALLITTLSSINHDVDYFYEENIGNFLLKVEKEKVVVFSHENDQYFKVFPYLTIKNIKSSGLISIKKGIDIYSKEDEIQIKERGIK